MPLPKIKHPIFPIKIPSTGKDVSVRPFLTHEEKILLMAKEGEEANTITKAMLQVLNNCIVDDTKVEELYSFDFDYLFVQLRALSVDNMVTVTVPDIEDEDKRHTVAVDLTKIKVDVDKSKLTKIITVDDELKIKLKYPTVAQMFTITELIAEVGADNISVALILGCIESVFNDEEVFTAESDEELLEFIQSLPRSAYQQIQQFLQDIPTLKHTIKVKHTDGVEREVHLKGINDFFIL